MGYFRGVSDAEARRFRLDKAAAEMRRKYLYSGIGCATGRKVIEGRARGSSEQGRRRR
jgi:hypothetical protein